MLDLDDVDLAMLCEALEDHSPGTTWYLNPRTGETFAVFEESEPGDGIDDDVLVRIDPVPPGDAYEDLEDFVARVRDPEARKMLERAIGGRGAFRRFKDTLFEFPDIRDAWFEFHDRRMERRAIRWLAANDLVGAEAAERASAARPDPDRPEISGAFDPEAIASSVARDLKELYGDRLRDVILFGSWARGDAHPESDIDLLVVLDEVDNRGDEHLRMNRILNEHSYANETVVVAIPASERDYRERKSPFLINVHREGRSVA